MLFQEIKQSQLKDLRKKILQHQNNKCALCLTDLSKDPKNQNVDHQHCTKSEELGVNGAGLIRGVLCRNCNALEGKFWNNSKRYGLVDNDDPIGSRIDWILNLLQYYKHNYQEVEKVLHPSERRVQKMSKTEYNKLKKWYLEQSSSYKKDGTLKPFYVYTGKWEEHFLKLLAIVNEQQFENILTTLQNRTNRNMRSNLC